MSDLLKLVIAAHGGMARWSRVDSVRASLSAGGALFGLKGCPGALSDVIHITANTRRPHLNSVPFLSAVQADWVPSRVTIERSDGLESRDDPRTESLTVPYGQAWDSMHLLYFMGYAIWNYLVTPFVFTWAGFEVHELPPWVEDGEELRRLRVVYPRTVPSHCGVQDFYFTSSGLLRRFDYSAEVLESARAVQYCDGYREFDGIMMPTSRRVYRRLDDNTADRRICYIEVDVVDAKVG